jgi:4-amino-4-deoxy-L-arabinose transferase-like glycosyltransferase
VRPGPSDRWILLAAALALLAGAFSPRDLWAPDEPRYGQIAREMLRDGSWLVPTSNGQPYAEKPPVFYWAVAALSAPFGDVTPWSARLVGALCAIGCLLAIQRLARRWYGAPGPPGTAVALFTCTLLITWNGSRAGLDLPLTCALLWAVERGGAWLRAGGWGSALGCGLCWTLAVLLKGPLGFVLPPAILAAESIALGHRPPARNVGWWLIPLVLVGTGLAWLLPALAAGGDAYADRLLGQIAGRVTGAEGGHRRPILYYAINWPAWALPMTGFLLLGGWAAIRAPVPRGESRAGLRATLVAGPVTFVLLSLTATKRELYLIPGLPFLALAGAWVLERGAWPKAARLATWVLLACIVAFALLVPFLPLIADRLLLKHAAHQRAPLDAAAWAALSVATVLLALAAVRGWRVRAQPVAVVRGAAPLLCLAWGAMAVGYLPTADPYKSWRPVAHAAEAAAGEGAVYHAGFPQGTNLLWALDRRTTPFLPDLTTLLEVLGPDRPRASAVVTRDFWEAAQRDASAQPDLARRLAALRVAWRDTADIREILVVTNGP